MTRTVVDTDVYSFLLKKSREALRFEPFLQNCQIILSFQTVAELFKWTIVRNWQQPRIDELEAAMRRCIIVPYDRDIAWTWARLTGECHKQGRPISAGDAWIAAAAIRYGIPLLTNNRRHYEAASAYCGLTLVDV